MATKSLVLTTAEHPAFVPSSPVRQSLQITKDVATRLLVPAPTRAPREAEASPTGTELGKQQTGLDVFWTYCTGVLSAEDGANSRDGRVESWKEPLSLRA